VQSVLNYKSIKIVVRYHGRPILCFQLFALYLLGATVLVPVICNSQLGEREKMWATEFRVIGLGGNRTTRRNVWFI